MSSYAWGKFHLAAEMLRQEGDKKNLLAEAFAQEICHIKEEDIPPKYRKKIDFVFERLSLGGFKLQVQKAQRDAA